VSERDVERPDPAQPLAAFAAFGEPTRRALYQHIADHGGWVGREEAADAVGISRTLAAHHLDRLAADGLLDVDYQRTNDRRGPGAGRPAKLYRRAARQIALSLPPRRFELVARLLAEAVDTARQDNVDLTEALAHSARQAGEAMAAARATDLPRRTGSGRTRAAVADELQARGYEPVIAPSGAITLRNCPFHELAQRHIDLVCGLNLALLEGLVDGLPAARLVARLAPAPGRCCVTLDPTSSQPS
jgi:predicted ArsR family transcriptional regulator